MNEAQIEEVAERILSIDVQNLGPQGFIGVETRYRKGVVFEKTGIRQCWRKITGSIDREKRSDFDYYGIWGSLTLLREAGDEENDLVYFAAVEEGVFEEIPDGLKRFSLPRTHYALASTKMYHEDWGLAVSYIREVWLPRSEYLRADGFNLEIYPPNHEEGFINLGVPVKHKR